jgi:hypothetical protein
MLSINNLIKNTTSVNEPVIDSACTDHVDPHRNNLTNYHISDLSDNPHVNYGGNKNFKATIMCTGYHKDNIREDVLHVPSSRRELISIPKLMGKYITIFVLKKCYIYTLNKLTLVMTGTLLEDNLVHLDTIISGMSFDDLISSLRPEFIQHIPTTSSRSNHMSVTNDRSESVFPMNKVLKDIKNRQYNLKLLKLNITDDEYLFGSAVNRIKTARAMIKNERGIIHNRCCHIGRHAINCMCINRTAIGICCTMKQLERCPDWFCVYCYLGMFNKFPAPRSMHLSAVDRNRTIISDIKGKFKCKSIFGNFYFQLHLCPGDEMLWITCMQNKSDEIDDIITLHQLFARGTNRTLGWHQSDYDVIYLDRRVLSWAQQNNIILQCTALYRHEGAIES